MVTVSADPSTTTICVDTGSDRGCRKRLGLCKRPHAHAEKEFPRSASLAVLALAACYLVAGRLALELLVCLGFLRLSNHILLTLAALASAGFVVCSLVLLHWRPTASLGQMLVERVIQSHSNWQTDTLRSFCEVGIWLSVIWSTYEATDGGLSGGVAALMCGTMAGVLLAVIGEALQAPLRDLEKFLREPSAASDAGSSEGTNNDEYVTLDSGSMMLFILFGFSAINTIYENVTDVIVACGLAVLGGLGILIVSKVSQVWEPTRRLGTVLQSRVLGTFDNWRSYPMRSALESSFFTSNVLGTYASQGDCIFALQVGTLSGIAVVVASELFAHGVVFSGSKPMKAEQQEQAALVPSCLLAYGTFALLVSVFAKENQTYWAALSIIVNSIMWVFAAHACLSLQSMQHAGHVINDRVVNAAKNWVEFPLRSLVEICIWFIPQLSCYAATNSVLVGAVAGTAVALPTVSCCEALGWGRLPWKALSPSEHPSKRGLSSACLKADGESIKGRTFSWAEVKLHSSNNDAWLVINGSVYDVTEWGPHHPGGSIIYKFAGADASDQFEAFHRPRVALRLRRFLIGRLAPPDDDEADPHEPSGATLEYRALREHLWREGYFHVRTSFFVGKGVVAALLFALMLALVLVVPVAWRCTRILGAGVLLGIALQQVAFITHDACHNGILEPKTGGGVNWLASFLGGAVFGVSTGMWNEEHSMHHAITLRPCEDPQFNYLPLWLISVKELDVPGVTIDWLMRFSVSIQHFTFLPLVIVIGRFNFHVISMFWALKWLVMAPTQRLAFVGLVDVLAMIAYWCWFAALVMQFGSLGERILFVLVSYTTAGCLHLQLMLSHLGTETFSEEEERAEQFFSFQLKTTRNIDAAWYDHWFHGGLEFQIEHHLFPQLPRHNLEKVKPFVKGICERHGIPYRSTSFSTAVLEVMQDLRRLSGELVRLRMG